MSVRKWVYFLILSVVANSLASLGFCQPGDPKNAAGGLLAAQGLVRAVGVSPDGKLAYSGDSNYLIRVWDIGARTLVRTIPTFKKGFEGIAITEIPSTFPCFAFSRDGKLALVGTTGVGAAEDSVRRVGFYREDALTLWSLETGAKLRSFGVDSGDVTCVALSADGKWALSTHLAKIVHSNNPEHFPSRLRSVRLWDTANGKLVRTLVEDSPGYSTPAAFSYDGKLCAVGCAGWPTGFNMVDGWEVKTWETSTGRALQSFKAQDDRHVTCLAFSPDAKSLATGSYYGARVWDLAKAQERWSCACPADGAVRFVVFSPDGKSLLAGGPETDYLVRLPKTKATGGLLRLDTYTGERDARFSWKSHWVRSAVFFPDGAHAMAATGDAATIVNAATGELGDALNVTPLTER